MLVKGAPDGLILLTVTLVHNSDNLYVTPAQRLCIADSKLPRGIMCDHGRFLAGGERLKYSI